MRLTTAVTNEMKEKSKTSRGTDKEMRAEYDFSGGVRGKHYKAMEAGYTITIHKEDGTTVVKDIKPKPGTIVLSPDPRPFFPNSESVNRTLRSLVTLVPRKGSTAKKINIEENAKRVRNLDV